MKNTDLLISIPRGPQARSVLGGLWLAFLLATAGRLGLAATVPAASKPLESISAIRALPPEEAARSLPVRVRGVATFWNEKLFSRFVQDETAGIYVQQMAGMPEIKPGQMVEIQGVTSPGEYAPVILPSTVQVLEAGRFPVAKPVTAAELVSGAEDSQFVEITGIVRAIRYEADAQVHLIDLVTGGERLTVYIEKLSADKPEVLVDSIVTVRGVCSTLFNRQRQFFGFRLMVPQASDLMVVQAAPADPFAKPAQTISSLLRFTPQGNHGRRVKVAGTVTCQEVGRAVFIQDESEGLLVQTRQRTPLQPGDRIEVVGFAEKGEYTPVLQEAIFRKTGSGAALHPIRITTDEALKGTRDCQLVELTATVLERTHRGPEQFFVLQSGGFNFLGYLVQGADASWAEKILNGSVISVTGISLLERGSGWQAGEGWRAKSFRMLLSGADAVQVLESPPWWNQPDKLRVIGIVAILLVGVLVFIDILRRRPRGAKPAL